MPEKGLDLFTLKTGTALEDSVGPHNAPPDYSDKEFDLFSHLQQVGQLGRAYFQDSVTDYAPVASRKMRLRLRHFRNDDLAGLVAADAKAFRSVYRFAYGNEEEMWQDLTARFTKRYNHIPNAWTDVIEDQSGVIQGFFTLCPTAKRPDEFISWDDTTNQGTLEGCYDESGEYLYSVSLTTVNSAASKGGQNMLMIGAIAKTYLAGKPSYFILRMPGLKKYVANHCRSNNIDTEDLSEEQLLRLAEEYSMATVDDGGKKRLVDPVLHNVAKMGCRFVKIAPNAYDDSQSMNFGMVSIYEPVVPSCMKIIPERLGRTAVGYFLRSCSKSLRVCNKLAGENDSGNVIIEKNSQQKTESLPESSEGGVLSWVRRHRLELALGLAATSPVAIYLSGATYDVVHELKSDGPLVGGALLFLEACWIGGAAVMLGSMGRKTSYNPLQIKKSFAELKAGNVTQTFKNGFRLNYGAALAQSGVLTGYTVMNLPLQSWGVLGIVGLDLAATVASRQVIWNSVKQQSA